MIVQTIRLTAVMLIGVMWLPPTIVGTIFAGTTSDVSEIQRLYDAKEYPKTLEELDRLDHEAAGLPDVRRLKIRTLLRLGKPKEALTEYETLTQNVKQEDRLLLREVALGFIVILTNDMREQMRGAAYTALKEWHSPESLSFLEAGLTDQSGLVRALAAEGLANFEAGRRSLKFRGALEDQAALVKEAVLKGFIKSHDASVISLIEPLLKDPEVRVRVAAAEVFCHLKRSKGCDVLVRYAKAPNPDERTAAIRALVELQATGVFPILKEASEHQQPSVRGAAATGFGRLPSAEALVILSRLLKDPLPPVRIAAAVSLGKFHGLNSGPLLIKALEDRDAAVRAFVIGALLEHGERYEVVADSVWSLTNVKEPAVRAAVARALGHAGETNRGSAEAALMVLVQDAVPRVRMAAVRSMAKVEGTGVQTVLRGALHDEDDAVRATAGGGLLTIFSSNE
ncbi:MAG TPA: HEAT repeat domain-containing protein [Nitrospira sp.]|nr:HEAT repeat domain-containing protein [Nitrospira sp.]